MAVASEMARQRDENPAQYLPEDPKGGGVRGVPNESSQWSRYQIR